MTKPPSAMFSRMVRNDSQYLWTECPACGRIGIEFEGRAGRLARIERGLATEAAP